jgi:RNA polymerase-interacting CarD/CdnL/TRCF family regulator
VLVSAKAEQIGERFASQTGAAAVLQKPFTPQGLLDAVARSLEALATDYEEAIPWNRDGRLLKDRFAEGELEAMVEVLASLVDTAETRKLNDGQRTLMEKVRKAYARELAAALKLDDEATAVRIDASIDRRIASK